DQWHALGPVPGGAARAVDCPRFLWSNEPVSAQAFLGHATRPIPARYPSWLSMPLDSALDSCYLEFVRVVYKLIHLGTFSIISMLSTRPSSKATPTHLKKHNEGLILSAIYAREAISRVQLARLTHLSRPAVTELTYGLLERGLISEV